jgi:hypothetical protein
MESMRHSSLCLEPSQVPSSKVARRYQPPSQVIEFLRRPQRVGMVTPSADTVRVTRVGERREDRDGAQEQPPQPDALALATLADPVHAVVPVACADQRQAVGAGQLEALVKASGAMLEE